jgi:hypothetical protein
MPGAKLSRMGADHRTVFVPALEEGKTQYVWLLQADGTWGHFRPMTDVQ